MTIAGLLAVLDAASGHSSPVARNPGVVLVDLAVTLPPVVELRQADAQPEHQQADGDLRLLGPAADEIDDLVAGVVGNPTSF